MGQNKENRELAELHLKIGTGYLTQRNYPLALKELLTAEDLDGSNYAVLNNLGLAYYLMGEVPRAIEKLQGAVQANPQYTEARNNLGHAYIANKQYAEAEKQLDIAVKDLTYTNPEKSWTNLGHAYFMQQRFDNARFALNKAMSLNREYCPAFTLYGRVVYEEKKYLSASEALEQAVHKCRMYQYDEPTYYGALSYLKLGKRELAKAKLQEVITLFPQSEFAEKAKSLIESMQ